MARMFARLDTVTDSLETWIDEMQPDMMIRSKEIPPFVRVARTRVVSGKMDRPQSPLPRSDRARRGRSPVPPTTEWLWPALARPRMNSAATWVKRLGGTWMDRLGWRRV